MEMGTLQPWAKVMIGETQSFTPTTPLLDSLPRPMGIAWPHTAILSRKFVMLSHCVRFVILAISFREIFCFFYDLNFVVASFSR
jgi:hypothetical protein